MTNEQPWGGETNKAVDNFPVSGETIPVPVVRWLGRIKAAAARTNARCSTRGSRIGSRQPATASTASTTTSSRSTSSKLVSTSSNMNANEVIAGEGVHLNDHVNMGQSSNDVFPSAVHPGGGRRGDRDHLLPALSSLADSFQSES